MDSWDDCIMSCELVYETKTPRLKFSNTKMVFEPEWSERIERAKENNGFTSEDIRLSLDWQSCAISERPEFRGKWVDVNKLKQYALDRGLEFHTAISRNKIDKAEKTLHKIQKMVKATK